MFWLWFLSVFSLQAGDRLEWELHWMTPMGEEDRTVEIHLWKFSSQKVQYLWIERDPANVQALDLQVFEISNLQTCIWTPPPQLGTALKILDLENTCHWWISARQAFGLLNDVEQQFQPMPNLSALSALNLKVVDHSIMHCMKNTPVLKISVRGLGYFWLVKDLKNPLIVELNFPNVLRWKLSRINDLSCIESLP